MNKIFRIVWNEAAQAWVAVSELTKKHKKRASVTAVAAALVAGMLSPLAEASSTDSDGGHGVPANPEEGYTTPRKDDLKDPNDEDLRGLGFGLAVVGKDGHRKPIKIEKMKKKVQKYLCTLMMRIPAMMIRKVLLLPWNQIQMAVQSHQRVQPATFT